MKNKLTVVKDTESGRIKFIRSSGFSYYHKAENGFKYTVNKTNTIMILKEQRFETEYKLSNKDEIIDVDLSDIDSINPNIIDVLIVDKMVCLVFETEVDGSPTKTHIVYDVYCTMLPFSSNNNKSIEYKDYCKNIILSTQDIYGKTPYGSINILENVADYDDVDPVPYKNYNYTIDKSLLLGPAFSKYDFILKLDEFKFKAIYKIECANKDYTASILKDFPELIPWQTYKIYAYKSSEESYCIELSYMDLLKYISNGNLLPDTFRNQDIYLKIPKSKLKTVHDEYVNYFTYWKDNFN